MATSLGKVGIVDKGNYSSEATYNSGDFVFYEGSTWLALKDALMGIEPVEGENWKYLARGVPDGIATLEQVGVVKPSIDLTIAEDGAIGINTVFESIAERANIESGDTWETVLGKINKYFGDIKPHAFLDKITEDYIDSVITQKVNNAIQNSAIVNNAVTTVEGTVLDGRMGKTLQDQITEQNKNIANFDGGLIVSGNPDDYLKAVRKRLVNAIGSVPFGSEGDNDFLLDVIASHDPNVTYQIAMNGRSNNLKFRRKAGKWSDWCQIVTNSDLNQLHKILDGTVTTNTVPSKNTTTINQINLTTGTYLIFANCTYDSSFSGYLTNYHLTKDDIQLITARNTGEAGSGQSLSFAVQVIGNSTIKFNVYQGSPDTRNINHNKLIAVKLL